MRRGLGRAAQGLSGRQAQDRGSAVVEWGSEEAEALGVLRERVGAVTVEGRRLDDELMPRALGDVGGGTDYRPCFDMAHTSSQILIQEAIGTDSGCRETRTGHRSWRCSWVGRWAARVARRVCNDFFQPWCS